MRKAVRSSQGYVTAQKCWLRVSELFCHYFVCRV